MSNSRMTFSHLPYICTDENLSHFSGVFIHLGCIKNSHKTSATCAHSSCVLSLLIASLSQWYFDNLYIIASRATTLCTGVISFSPAGVGFARLDTLPGPSDMHPDVTSLTSVWEWHLDSFPVFRTPPAGESREALHNRRPTNLEPCT